jgi:hypothetical protein
MCFEGSDKLNIVFSEPINIFQINKIQRRLDTYFGKEGTGYIGNKVKEIDLLDENEKLNEIFISY